VAEAIEEEIVYVPAESKKESKKEAASRIGSMFGVR